MITVVGLGVKEGDLTERGRRAILSAKRVVVRTAQTESYKNVTALGGRAAIAAAKPQVERIIRLSAIDKIIPLYKDVDEAINAIESTKEEVR